MKSQTNRKTHRPRRIAARAPDIALPVDLAVKQLMQRFELAFSTRNVEGVMQCLGPGFEWRLPDGRCYSGRRAVRMALTQRFSASNGPRFSKSRFRFYGHTVVQTYRVNVLDGGGWKELRGCDVYKIRNGLLVRKDAYWKGGPTAAVNP